MSARRNWTPAERWSGEESFEKKKEIESLLQKISSELRTSKRWSVRLFDIDKIPTFRTYIRICAVSCVYIKDISSRETIG